MVHLLPFMSVELSDMTQFVRTGRIYLANPIFEIESQLEWETHNSLAQREQQFANKRKKGKPGIDGDESPLPFESTT